MGRWQGSGGTKLVRTAEIQRLLWPGACLNDFMFIYTHSPGKNIQAKQQAGGKGEEKGKIA